MSGIVDFREPTTSDPVIKVIGVGGGGGNAVNRMIESGVKGVEFVVANTDLKDLKSSLANHKIQLGSKCARGLGAGAKPGVGRESAVEDIEAIKEHIVGADMVFITAGLGGGTGTGAAPVIAEAAKEQGTLTVGVVTRPFKFEGKVRSRNCDEGITQLSKHVDTLIVIPNENLLLLANKNTSIIDAFTMADDVLRVAVQGISEVIRQEALINLDFADVQTIMSNKGQAIMGTGVGTGENRAIDAADKAISSPLLDDCRIDGAKGVLINVTGPPTMTLHEINEVGNFISDHADDDANIIWGARIDETMEGEHLEVTVIATGFLAAAGAPIRSSLEEREEPTPGVNFGQTPQFNKDQPEGESFYNKPHLSLVKNEPGERDLFAFSQDSEIDAYQEAKSPEEDIYSLNDQIAERILQEEGANEKEKKDSVYELENPIMEPIETTHQFPASYSPENGPSGMGSNNNNSLDTPTFIRRRSARFADES